MTLPSFAEQTVVVVTAGTKSVHGNTTDDWSTPTSSTAVPGCSVQPGTGGENTEHRDATLVQWTVFMPPGTAVDESNHLKWGGIELQIVQVLRWELGLAADHVEVLANKWKG